MSGRSIPRFALAGLLAVAFAAPVVAQEGSESPYRKFTLRPAVPEAPMPRAKGLVACEFELSLGLLKVQVHETQMGAFGVGLAVGTSAAASHEANGYPCCGAGCCRKPAAVVAAGDVVQGACTRTADHRQYFNFSVGIFGGEGTVLPPAAFTPVAPPAPPAPCGPKPSIFVQRPVHGGKVIEVVAVEACPPCPLPPVTANPLLGTWYRDLGIGMVAVTFTHDEMKLTATQTDGDAVVTLKLTAHYTMTKDGLVYGAITSVDVDVKQDSKGEPSGMELAELSLALQELTDGPFSFRTKMTSSGLMVSHVKAVSVEGIRGKELAVFGGLYKSAKDGKVPAPVVKNVGRASNGVPPSLVDTPLPPPPPMNGPLQRVGVDFSFTPPVLMPPCVHGAGTAVAAACPTAPAPRPACNDPMKTMAADAFGQMLRAGTQPAGGMLLPSPRYLEHYPQYFPPDPAFPMPRELASQEDPEGAVRRATPSGVQGTVPGGTPVGSYVVLPAGAAPMPFKNVGYGTPAPVNPSHLGAWFREIGSKQCVVKIEADHLTITVSEAQELNDKKMTGHLTFTADYSLTRDGMTAVGLITNVDVKFEGDVPDDDMPPIMEKIRELQKSLEDKPFAMTFRRYGETLVIGNVRMPDVGDGMESQPASYIGGRYANVGSKPLPKLKAVKVDPKPLPAFVPPPGFAPGVFGPGVYGPPLPVSGPVSGPPAFVPPYGPPSAFPPVGAYPQAGTLPPPPAPGGDLLPPQSIPCPAAPRPVEFVAPASRPTMSEPVAPVPTMPEPIPPAVSVETAIPRPLEIAVSWTPKVTFLPDPTRNGAPGAGLSGTVLLPAGAKGTLTVDLVDATPPTAGHRAVRAERWQFDKVTLNRLATEEPNGLCHALFLPWQGYKSDVERVRLTVRFDSEDGKTLLLPTVVVPLVAERNGVGSMIRTESEKTPKLLFNFTTGVFGSQ